MAETTPGETPSVQTTPRHEQKDIHLRSVLLPGVTLVVLLMVFSGASWWLLNAFAARPPRSDVSLSPLAQGPQVPPAPRLQENPAIDLAKRNATYDTTLHSYGWIDKNAGRVHIPIERAKELVMKERPSIRSAGGNEGGKTP